MTQKKQDKQRELDMFDVKRNDAFDLQPPAFHLLLKARLNQCLPHLFSGSHEVLEAGCGTGAFGRFFIKALDGRAVWKIMGVDIAPAMIEWNKKHPLENYDSTAGDLEDATLFKPGTFDLVLCPMVLHHFPDAGQAIGNLAAWLKPGGYIYLIEPNGSSPVNRLSKFVRHIIERVKGLEYAKRFATVNETDHTVRSYQKWLAQNQCEIVHEETYLPPTEKKPAGLISCIRFFLYKITGMLPHPWKGSVIILMARKI